MRVLHPKASEANDRITVGNVVLIAVGIEQQVRNVQHKYAAVSEREASGQVEAIEEIMSLVRLTVPICVLKNRDAVGSFRPARWRFREPFVSAARPAVNLCAFQPGRVWILNVLDDPKPSA